MNLGTDHSRAFGDGFTVTKPEINKRIGEGPDPSSPSWRDAVGIFWTDYEKPLTDDVSRRMRARGVPEHLRQHAQDYVRDFLVKIIKSPSLFSTWNPQKGRFRTWISLPCWWHVETELRRESPGRLPASQKEESDDAAPSPKGKAGWRRFESLGDAKAEQLVAKDAEPAAGAGDLDLAAERTWLFLLWIEAISLWHDRHWDCRRWRLFANLVLVPYSKADRQVLPADEPTAPPQIKDVFNECGYETASQAYYGFEKFKKQFVACVQEILRERYASPAATPGEDSEGGDDASLTARIDTYYEKYQRFMTHEIELRRAYPVHPEAGDGGAAGVALERFLDQLAGTAHPLLSDDSSRSEVRGPTAHDDEFGELPDLEACTLGLIAAVLTQTTHEPTRQELEDGLREYLSLPWKTVVGQAADSADTAESVGDVIHADEPRSEQWRQIKDAAEAARTEADGDVWDDALSAVYYACLAAEIVATGGAAGPEFTSLSAGRQAEGLRWLSRRLWVEPRTSELASRALKVLQKGGVRNAE